MLKTLLSLALSIMATTSGPAFSQKITMEAVNEATWKSGKAGATSPRLIRLQVLLDRAHASPGALDGQMGTNTRRAIAAFREMSGEGDKGGEEIDEQLWQTLTSQDNEPVLVRHVINDADVEGPFIEQMPTDFHIGVIDHMSNKHRLIVLAR